jgi:hypothetical protein
MIASMYMDSFILCRVYVCKNTHQCNCGRHKSFPPRSADVDCDFCGPLPTASHGTQISALAFLHSRRYGRTVQGGGRRVRTPSQEPSSLRSHRVESDNLNNDYGPALLSRWPGARLVGCSVSRVREVSRPVV